MTLDQLHSLLRRQLRRTFGDDGPPGCPQWDQFVAAVDESYREADRDRELLERSLALSSDELVEANASLRAVFDASPDLHLWLSNEGEVRRVHCNDASKMHGCAGTAIGGKVWDVPDPAVAHRFARSCRRARDSRQVVSFEYQFGSSGDRRDYEARVFPLSTSELMAVVRNITDRRRAEVERFRELAESIDAVFWISDPTTGSLLYLSPAYERVWGRSVASAYQNPQPLVTGIHPDDRSRVMAALRRQTDGTYDEEYRVVRPDGSVRWVRDRAFPLRDQDGQVFRINGITADITQTKNHQAQIETLNDELEVRVEVRTKELARAAESLRQAQKMEAVGRLAGGVAHDFNNLLAVILTCADLALASLDDPEEVTAELKEVRNTAVRAADLIRELLTFSRRQVLAPKLLDVNAAVQDTDRMLARLIRTDIELTTWLGDDVPKIWIDRSQLGQIIMNLAVNARDAMPEGGRMLLATRRIELRSPRGKLPAGLYAALEVRDTGVGIPADVMDHVFEPFFTTKREGSGTGLGLATVYGIVEQAGGDIEVTSAPGRGSRFTVYFPAAGPGEQGLRVTSAPDPTSRRGRILLAEDEPCLRKSIQRILENAGHSVVSVPDGAQAIRLVRAGEAEFDLVITDVVMPEMNGRELCDVLRAEWPSIRLLYMTGYTDDQLVRYGVADGSAELLHKPFTTRDLLTRVGECLASEAVGPVTRAS